MPVFFLIPFFFYFMDWMDCMAKEEKNLILIDAFFFLHQSPSSFSDIKLCEKKIHVIYQNNATKTLKNKNNTN